MLNKPTKHHILGAPLLSHPNAEPLQGGVLHRLSAHAREERGQDRAVGGLRDGGGDDEMTMRPCCLC